MLRLWKRGCHAFDSHMHTHIRSLTHSLSYSLTQSLTPSFFSLFQPAMCCSSFSTFTGCRNSTTIMDQITLARQRFVGSSIESCTSMWRTVGWGGTCSEFQNWSHRKLGTNQSMWDAAHKNAVGQQLEQVHMHSLKRKFVQCTPVFVEERTTISDRADVIYRWT